MCQAVIVVVINSDQHFWLTQDLFSSKISLLLVDTTFNANIVLLVLLTVAARSLAAIVVILCRCCGPRQGTGGVGHRGHANTGKAAVVVMHWGDGTVIIVLGPVMLWCWY